MFDLCVDALEGRRGLGLGVVGVAVLGVVEVAGGLLAVSGVVVSAGGVTGGAEGCVTGCVSGVMVGACAWGEGVVLSLCLQPASTVSNARARMIVLFLKIGLLVAGS